MKREDTPPKRPERRGVGDWQAWVEYAEQAEAQLTAQPVELRELREALGRAADQFAQTASALDALGHHVFAVAMRIAEEATRRALSTPEAGPQSSSPIEAARKLALPNVVADSPNKGADDEA